MSEYAGEPVPGLPGHLPPGETMLWQGSPDWRVLARTAFHTHLVAGYFVLLAGWAVAVPLARGALQLADLTGVAATLAAGIAAVGVLRLLAWASARSTIYTLTDRRLVLRVGIAVPKCINLPLGQVAAVDLALREDGSGDLPIVLTGAPKLGYLTLWPHARAWRIVRPEPMLRALPDAADVAALIARTCLAANPTGQMSVVGRPSTEPSFGEAVPA